MNDLFDLPFDETVVPSEPVRHVVTVSELTANVRLLLESKYKETWVEGEISNARVWKTGHLYFTLKDANAQLKAVMFRSTLRHQRFRPDDGQHVIARGQLSVYEPKGEYQIVCQHLEPHGLGALQLAFNQLKQRLNEEGLFDTTRKRSLPPLPRKIGIVTSLDGAVVRDIIKVLRRRHPNIHLVISPTRVQGDSAASEIVLGIQHLFKISGIDVIIVARGGGSIEDLWAFNEEQVARVIAAAPVPVISAVGHETDYTISDFVADLRAATPSAAAELVIARKDEIETRIIRLTERPRETVRGNLQRRRAAVHSLQTRPGLSGWPTQVAMRGRQIDELAYRLSQSTRDRIIGRQRQRLHELRLQLEGLDLGRQLGIIRNRLLKGRGALISAMRENHRKHDSCLRVAASRLGSLSPLAVLARGYAVCWSADRSSIIRDATKVAPGQDIHITLHHGSLECEIKKAK